MFTKHITWLDQSDLDQLRKDLTTRQTEPLIARKAVCTPLSPRVEIGIVEPVAWKKSELCKRQLSWYWTSKQAGQSLVISSTDLATLGLSTEITLTVSAFKPVRLPGDEEKLELLSSRAYQRLKPSQWDDLESQDPAEQKRWLRVMGIKNLAYEDLFLTHCANHANFIEPKYFIQEGDRLVPYSIAATKYICSACLEFFNIIGEGYSKKLVMPCPGAVLFAGLPVNRYLEVVTH